MSKVRQLLALGELSGGASAPTCTITATVSDIVSGVFTVTVTFSSPVTGFEVGDITAGNGSAGNFAGSGAVYTADITPTATGTVTVDVAAGVCTPANLAATQFSIVYVDAELFFVSYDDLFQDAGKTTPAVANDDPVGNFPDGSGNSRDATGAAGVRPLLKTNILGDISGVLWDGSDDKLTTPSFNAGIGFGDCCLFLVCNGSIGNHAIVETGNGNVFMVSNVPICFIGSWMTGYTLPTDTNPHVVVFRVNGGVGVNVWVDGVKDSDGGVVPAGAMDNTTYILGGSNYPFGTYGYGAILVKGTLSDAAVEEVSDALSARFLV